MYIIIYENLYKLATCIMERTHYATSNYVMLIKYDVWRYDK